MRLEESDERRVSRVGVILEYGVLLYAGGAPHSAAATSFVTVKDAGVDAVLEWANSQGSAFSIGAFVGTSARDREPVFVWLLGEDPNDEPTERSGG